MSQLVRQSNLFAAEDWKVIYRSFQDADFKSYDFDTIRASMLNYINRNYPEEFNDYINSSEFIAIIDLLAYLGQSLSFRVDLNARENFIDTASRRDSILKLANMLSYKPTRNVPARGLVKLTSIKTSEPVTDTQGNNLSNTEIRWNDPNNPNWYEQFILVLNSALSSTNQFGKPVQSKVITSITNDLYNFNNERLVQVAFPFSAKVNNNSYKFECVPTKFNSAGFIEEASPNPLNAFNVIYKNDGKGYASNNTGFFFFFKEGALDYRDYNFDKPEQNKTLDIDVPDINNLDVWVQEINNSGLVQNNWDKVPTLSGQNIIYNSLALNKRNIFDVQTRTNDQISIQFSDGSFGNIPVGLYRVWYRSSKLRGEPIGSNDIQNKGIRFDYLNKANQTFSLSLTFSLNYAITNSSGRETAEEIKINSAQAYYTQDRMITAEDYNVFPVTKVDGIQKIKAINKTHAGHSRFVDIQDPTGTVANVNCIGEDGIAYKSPNNREKVVSVLDNSSYEVVIDEMEKLIQNTEVQNFYYDTYKKDIETNTSTGANTFRFDESGVGIALWRTMPTASSNAYGYFTSSPASDSDSTALSNKKKVNGDPATNKHGYIRNGSKIEFVDTYNNPTKIIWATVKSVTANGDPANLTTGPIQLSESIPSGYFARSILPSFRTSFNTTERANILAQLTASSSTLSTFGLGYNYYNTTDKAEEWYIISTSDIDTTGDFTTANNTVSGGSAGTNDDASWFIKSQFTEKSANTSAKFTVTSKGLDYVFQSSDDVRFFYVKDYKTLDTETGLTIQDRIDILKDVNTTIVKGTGAQINASINLVLNLSGTTSIPEGDTVTQQGTGATGKASSALVGGNVLSLTDVRGTFSAGNSAHTLSSNSGGALGRYPTTKTAGGVTGFYNAFNNASISASNSTGVDYTVPPVLTMSGGSGSGAQAVATVNNGNVIAVTPTVNGTGYMSPPTVTVTTPEIGGKLEDTIQLAVVDNFTEQDGYVDERKVKVAPFDSDEDGTPDYPLAIDDLIQDTSETKNYIFFESYQEFDNYTYYKLSTRVTPVASLTNSGIEFLTTTKKFYNNGTLVTTTGSENQYSAQIGTVIYRANIGRAYQTPAGISNPLFFQWKHTAPRDQRIDPSISNIIELIVLTSDYYDDVISWTANNLTADQFPVPPSVETLNSLFSSSLNSYKAIGDQLIYTPAKFKKLFGATADASLQGTFKVIKAQGATLTDNEIKARVLASINNFFSITNWSYGESFYYTELCAFIHSQLSSQISSVVIVGADAESVFGDLFEITSESNELFYSTATVDNIEIINSFTDQNLKKGS